MYSVPFSFEHKIGRCGQDVGKPLEVDVDRNKIHWRETCNRGPLMLHASRTQDLGYFDEQRFFLGDDDHDLIRRASENGWKAAYLPVDFYSPLNLSARRNTQFRDWTPEPIKMQEAAYKQYRINLARRLKSA